jgi:hypothetical protein
MKRNSVVIVLSLLVCTVIAGLSGCKQGVPVVTIESADAKLSPMIVGSGSIFMKIVNAGGGDDMLVAARAGIPGAVTELHDVKEGKMTKIENMRIPSKSTVVLMPGSLHIMIFNMPKEVKEGSQFSLALTFKKSGVITVPVIVTSNEPNHSEGHSH